MKLKRWFCERIQQYLCLVLLFTAVTACQQPPTDPIPTLINTPKPISTPLEQIVTSPGTAVSLTPPLAITGDSTPESSSDPNQSYLPLVNLPPDPTLPSNTTDTIDSTPSTAVPSINPLEFDVIRDELRSSGQELAFAKIGFHVTLLNEEELTTLIDHLRLLDAAGVPFFLKSASNAEPLYYAQQMMQASGVPHTLVYRSTEWDVPEYHLSPDEAAQLHWQRHRDTFPPELDPNLVWIETVNEIDKNESEWLAQFSLKTAELALADGFRWAAFGWASGEPEPGDWDLPVMLQFLRLVGDNPDRLSIALHEYSFLADDIKHLYPYKVGRFQELFRVVDQYNIPRPTVLITEWGWAYDEIPPVDKAMEDIRWAAALYAPFPQIKGAAIWNLGELECCLDEISRMVIPLIAPVTEYSLTHYFAAPLPPNQAPLDPVFYQP